MIKILSKSQFKKLYPKAIPQVVSILTRPSTFLKNNIITQLQYNHFMSQIAHESAGFSALVERRSATSAESKYGYTTRTGTILGNKRPGDGNRFKGRGLIQLTGRWNYTYYNQYLTDYNILRNPNLLESPKPGTQIAFTFWNVKKLSIYIGTQDLTKAGTTATIKLITKKLNGGLNGIKSRTKEFERISKATA